MTASVTLPRMSARTAETNMWDRWSYRGLLILIAFAPLPLAGNRPLAWSALAIFAGLLLALWGLGAIRDETALRVSGGRIRWIAGGFAAIVLWQVFQLSGLAPDAWHHPLWAEARGALGRNVQGRIALDPGAGYDAILRLVTYGAVFWLALQHGREAVRAETMLRVFGLSAAAFALYGLVEYFSGESYILWFEKWAYRGDLTSTFVNRNAFASYAGLALIAMTGLLVRRFSEDRITRIGKDGNMSYALAEIAPRHVLLLLAVLVLATGLFLTHSRAGLVSTLAGLGVLAGLGLLARRSGGRGPILAGATLAILVGLVFAISGGGTLKRFDEDGTPFDIGRAALFERVMEAALRRPFLGHGPGAFETAFTRFRTPEMAYMPAVDKAHNVYLETMFEDGVPAALLRFSVIGAVIAGCVQAARQRSRNLTFPIVAAASAMLVALHGLVDFTVQMPAVAISFAMLIGLGYAQSFSSRDC